MTEDPEYGWLTDTGPLIRLTEDQIANHGPEILLENLAAFDKRVYEKGEFSSMAMDEKRKFDRTHDDVAVTLKSRTQLELQPMVRVAGKKGRTGDNDDAVTVRLPASPKKLWDALMLAYSRCR